MQRYVILLFALIAMSACKKSTTSDLPTTLPILNVTGAYATGPTTIEVSGAVTGGFPLTGQGVYLATTSNGNMLFPVQLTQSAALGFQGTIPNLKPNSSYQVGVYATNAAGTIFIVYSQLVQTPAQ